MSNKSDIDIKSLIELGNTLDKKGDKLLAAKTYQKAFELDNKNTTALTNLSIIHYELNNLDISENFSQKLLKLDKNNSSVLINLGNIFYQKQDLSKAASFYKKADASKKNYYHAKINLANLYSEQKKYSKAISFAKEAFAIDKSQKMPLMILGTSYFELDELDDSLDHLQNALKLDSNDPWIYNYISQIYQKKGLWKKALENAFKAVEKSDGKDDNQHINFCYLIYESTLEDKDSFYQTFLPKWEKFAPHNNIVFHAVNALKNNTLDRANNDYVRAIFDIFAPSFEQTLKKLSYQAPMLIEKELKQINRKNIAILDLGCGTGLCGKFLKKYTGKNSLTGVDISPQMLLEAKQKNVYNQLIEQDIETYLSSEKNLFDLIILADVITYFGNIEKLFSLLSKRLAKNGIILFTITKNTSEDKDYFLHSSGRFSHSKSYIQNILKSHNFQTENFYEHSLRTEGDKEVCGYFFHIKRQ